MTRHGNGKKPETLAGQMANGTGDIRRIESDRGSLKNPRRTMPLGLLSHAKQFGCMVKS